jgi:hypothetical protein
LKIGATHPTPQNCRQISASFPFTQGPYAIFTKVYAISIKAQLMPGAKRTARSQICGAAYSTMPSAVFSRPAR